MSAEQWREAYRRAEIICERVGREADEARAKGWEPSERHYHRGRAAAADEIRMRIANLSPGEPK